MSETKPSFRTAAGKPVQLVLYMFASCPFCQKVMRRAAALGLEIPHKDIRLDRAAWAELLKIGGKTTVPCLIIDGKPLYESDDIIAYLDGGIRAA